MTRTYFVRFETSLDPFRERLAEHRWGLVRGERLADKLASELGRRGVQVKEREGTSYSWQIYARVKDRVVLLELAPHPDGSGWFMSCNSTLNFLERLFGRRDGDEVFELALVVDGLLHEDATITLVRWALHYEGGETTPHPVNPESLPTIKIVKLPPRD
ncbi:MAG TPA: hypothetical protein VM261_30860 [Kofleriaceae bacterium]|nr:hypothetical protein [Kofleriaceae bacterium]